MRFIKVTVNKDSSPMYVNVDHICAIQNDYQRFVNGTYSAEIIVNNGTIFVDQSVEEVMQLINEGNKDEV